MYNCLLLILLNIAYFVCNRYPKHIIELGSSYAVFSVIFNLAFYVIFSLLIVVSFGDNKMLFSGSQTESFKERKKKKQIKKIGLILLCQILIDVLLLILGGKLNTNINRTTMEISSFYLFLLGIARSYLSKSEIIIIYEFPHELNQTEIKILENVLNKIRHKKTILIFTAKNIADKFADRLIKVENGKVNE